MRTIVVWIALVGCGESSIMRDAGEHEDAGRIDSGRLDSGRACSGACDDGLFCNGVGTCDPSSPMADARGCVAGVPPCDEGTSCEEMSDSCEPGCEDADRDGHESSDCGGDDCNDAQASVRPGAAEICNAVDDDCDGEVDDGVAATFYEDADGDGFGAMDATLTDCTPPAGYSFRPGDCDDADATVHPAAIEICDAGDVDEDCDGVANPAELCPCIRGTVRPCALPGTCAAGVETCIDFLWSACSVAPIPEVCNATDDDCDGAVDEALTVTCFVDMDGDSYAPTGALPVSYCPVPARPTVGGCPVSTTNRSPALADCADTSSAIHPGAPEVCGVPSDEDCDAVIDEGC